MPDTDPAVRRTIEVRDPEGLHARSLSGIVRIVRGADADVQVSYDGNEARAASILSMKRLLLFDPAGQGSFHDGFEVRAEGPDAEAVVEEIEDFVRFSIKPNAATAVNDLLRALRDDRDVYRDLVDLLTDIMVEERVTDEQRRRLRFHRDHLRFCFGRLARLLRLDEVEREPPEGVGKLNSRHAEYDWSGEAR